MQNQSKYEIAFDTQMKTALFHCGELVMFRKYATVIVL